MIGDATQVILCGDQIPMNMTKNPIITIDLKSTYQYACFELVFPNELSWISYHHIFIRDVIFSKVRGCILLNGTWSKIGGWWVHNRRSKILKFIVNTTTVLYKIMDLLNCYYKMYCLINVFDFSKYDLLVNYYIIMCTHVRKTYCQTFGLITFHLTNVNYTDY